MSLKCLNLGCGDRFNVEWTNLDLVPRHPDVVAHDVLRPLPFPDGAFDVVYHSHLLEHLEPDSARSFLTSCRRVLRASGVLRVVVPDLEEICRQYLKALEGALAGDSVADANHQWMLLEMFDQMIRDRTGGGFADALRKSNLRNVDFVRARWGAQGDRLLDLLSAPPAPGDASPRHRQTTRWFSRLAGLLTSRSARRELLLRRVLGEEYRLLQKARFRAGGEIHQWMYDQHSLACLLREAGFIDPVRRRADESGISDWCRWNLDVEPDGRVSKPDSLFMEARRS